MSTTPATRTLFARWIDDAAVFPPGNAPVPQAWAEHLALRAGGYADLLGPLLVGASAAGELVDAAAAAPPPEALSPVAVVPIARAGTPVDDLLAAVEALRESPHLEVVGTEVAHDPEGSWRQALTTGRPTAVEVPREGAEMIAALDDLAGAAGDEGAADESAHEGGAVPGPRIIAKLRTQATAEVPAPSARTLAEFLCAAHDRHLPVKLTGGLHRAVARPGEPEPHGALNLLIAVHHLLHGAGLRSLEATLELPDGPALASLAAGLTEQTAADVRATFVSFGCCGVLDPIGDLAGLSLLAEAPAPPAPTTAPAPPAPTTPEKETDR